MLKLSFFQTQDLTAPTRVKGKLESVALRLTGKFELYNICIHVQTATHAQQVQLPSPAFPVPLPPPIPPLHSQVGPEN
jgi:hypothetical protein